MFSVVRVTNDHIHGITVESFGPYALAPDADRYRRKLLAEGAERWPGAMARQQPKVFVTGLEVPR